MEIEVFKQDRRALVSSTFATFMSVSMNCKLDQISKTILIKMQITQFVNICITLINLSQIYTNCD